MQLPPEVHRTGLRHMTSSRPTAPTPPPALRRPPCRGLLALLAGSTILAGALSARADDPEITDEAVATAIERGVAWIKAQRNDAGVWEGGGAEYNGGDTGLALLALLYAGEDPRRDEMKRGIDWLAGQSLKHTYTYGTRAHVLALAGKTYREKLQSDLTWLVDNCWPRGEEGAGAYAYEGRAGGKSWDNSNSQYGVLGVWMATDAGLTVPESYWQLIAEHWMNQQSDDGGWTYGGKGTSTGSMTAAGLATLYVILDRLYNDRPKDNGRLLTAIDRALGWFGRYYGPENHQGDQQWQFYYLYGVERIGRASGQKYFRNKDWFREGASYLLREQRPDGNWSQRGEHMSDLRNTAFAIMFLCHGRAPLLFNKLQHGDDWNSKMRDVPGLNRYAEKSLERLLNWQIVRLDGTMDDLLEAPVLYLCGETPWTFSDVEVQKIREYCQRGGLVFGVAAHGKDDFVAGFQALAKRAFPEFPLRPLPDNHPLFSGEVNFPIEKPPSMFEVHSGARTLMLLCAEDIAETWNKAGTRKGNETHFQLACNVYMYATDKSLQRSRLETPSIPLRERPIDRKIEVARIKYAGAWDVEPYGWTRLKNYLNNETASTLLVTSGVTLDSEDLQAVKIAYMSGTAAFELTPAERSGLRKFLSSGGTLLADAAGGAKPFVDSFEKELRDVLKEDPRVLPPDSFLVTGKELPGGLDLADVGYRRNARTEARARKYPALKAFGRTRLNVIFSTLDLSTGLLGTQVYNVRGYDPNGSLKILRNMLMYASLSSSQKTKLK